METLPFPLNKNYAVTRDGRVQRVDTGRWLKPTVQKRGGYLAVSLWQNNKGRLIPLHQVVAYTFCGPRPSPSHVVAHRDGNKLNNDASNLRWATRQENEHDKIAHGRTNRGERNGQSKISDADARAVIAAYASGQKQQVIADRFGIDQSHVSNIVRGKRRFANEHAHS